MARSGVLTDNLAQRSPAIAAMTLWLMQEHISIRWFWHRLRYVYTALTRRELVRIEKETLLLLCASDGLPCDGPYLTYAEQLWNTADLVRMRAQPPVTTTEVSPRSRLPSLPQWMGVQPALPQIMTPWF